MLLNMLCPASLRGHGKRKMCRAMLTSATWASSWSLGLGLRSWISEGNFPALPGASPLHQKAGRRSTQASPDQIRDVLPHPGVIKSARMSTDHGLSVRGMRSTKRTMAYFDAVMKLLQRPWTHADKEGNIVMSIAENRLTADLVQKRLQECTSDIPSSVFFYDNMSGIAKFKTALARMLEHTFMKGLNVEPELLTISSGCGAIVDNAIFALTDAGDGVLLPAPYYPAFDWDLTAKNEAVPIPVHLSASQGKYDLQLDHAAADFVKKTGKRVKVLLVTNPDNPTGKVYSREQLSQMLSWCLENGVHYISDEVYANAIFGKAHFVSIEQLVEQEVQEGNIQADEAQNFVHTIFGLSKDWCASGLRVGCMYTHNPMLCKSLNNMGYFCGVSGLAQYILARALEDLSWVDMYLTENANRLGASYNILADCLTKAKIPFQPAVATVFCLVDLRKALAEPTWEAERELWEDGFVQRAGLIITPGKDCHCVEPGFFRICYAIVLPEVIPLLVRRITDFISKSPQERRQVPIKPWLASDKAEVKADGKAETRKAASQMNHPAPQGEMHKEAARKDHMSSQAHMKKSVSIKETTPQPERK